MAKKNNIAIKEFFSQLKGDKVVWALTALLAIFSFLPIYSASSNLAYLHENWDTTQFLLKHFMHIFFGFVIMFAVHRIPYRYFRGLSILVLPVVVILLIYTISQGKTIQGVSANRWIKIPLIDGSFQTSTLATVVLMVYVARYLSKTREKAVTFKESILPLWLPVACIIGLILPDNFSTAAISFAMVLLLTFIGGYPFKNILTAVGLAIAGFALFIGVTKAFPEVMPHHRVDTWISRVETFLHDDDKKVEDAEFKAPDDYQIERSKVAIARGGLTGIGIGKSIERNFLPQSSSDFIFAIIVEEMGVIGGFGVMVVYMLLLYRIVLISTKSDTVFGKLLVIGVGLPIIFQAFINMAVAVELFPVTGQTLPLISDGGTSIWMTCAALGIILGVSVKRNEEKVIQLDGEESENPLDILSEAI